jgi:hypothetical protein
MTARRVGWIILVLLACGSGVLAFAVLARRRGPAPVQPDPIDSKRQPTPTPDQVEEVVFDGGFGPGWRDWGWGPHEIKGAGPARIRFSDFGGIVFHHDEFQTRFGALVFRFQAPHDYGQFLAVSLKYKQLDERVLPKVSVESQHTASLADGWSEVFIPWQALNPSGKPFDRITIEARLPVGSDWVPIDRVVLTKADHGGDAASTPRRTAMLRIDCAAPAVRISPLIYGIAKGAPGLGETAHRIGGNPSSRTNWDLGVWNTASDWFFENTGGAQADEIEEGHRQGVKMAVTMPMLGWVAKDAVSVAFPISQFGMQRARDPGRQAGDGFRPDGTPLVPAPPTITSVPAPPETIGRWISKVRERDAARGGRGVWMYMLDNEPDLWHVTHRDVHPQPLDDDELLDRTVRYGAAIRAADPEAVIAGPASWGWSGYFDSAKDLAGGWRTRVDRRAHGDVPLLAWYLGALAAYEKKAGVRILDVLDVHFYPQGQGIYGKGAGTDPDTSARRLRSTRGLWDPTYRDESWIDKAIFLIPRLKEWVAKNYPGTGISIGEWSFGAEEHMSGGLAIAEALGRFGQQAITSAFYWFEVKEGTPAFNAFRAFRNFDDKGGHFLDWSMPTQGSPDISLFSSRDESGSQIVAVLLNLDPTYESETDIDLASCGGVASRRLWKYLAGSSGFVRESQLAGATEGATHLQVVLAPYSMSVIDITPSAPLKH